MSCHVTAVCLQKTIISTYLELSHLWSSQSRPRQVTGLFFIHKINTPTKWSCDCCNSTLLCLQSGCSGAWSLSYYHLLTQAIMPIFNWGTNQTVDMFRSFNPAWSPKVFYIKLITDDKDFSYGSEIGWNDAQYHEADRYLKWLCYANFCAFHRNLKYDSY